jgi:hypothetical protein
MRPCHACHPLSRYELLHVPEENRFELTLGGTIGDHEFLHGHQRLMRSAAFRADTAILCDLSQVEFWGLTAAFLAEVATLPGISPRNRWALVARPGLGQDILHFLRMNAGRGQVRVFDDCPSAQQWLKRLVRRPPPAG